MNNPNDDATLASNPAPPSTIAGSPLIPSAPASTTNETGRYHPVSLHARGGLGEVHIANDSELHRPVALKRIRPERADDARSRERFLREAEVTARLQHPGIVPVYGLSTDALGRPSYAMRFVEGESLHEAIGRLRSIREASERSIPFRKLLQHFIDVCEAIAYAHSRGVIHRDLKPANIMLGPFGETYVVDWGLAKVLGSGEWGVGSGGKDRSPAPVEHSSLSSDLTEEGDTVGTPAYMSPEQASGVWDRVGPASDIYSLGAILYCILTGKPPLAGEDWPESQERLMSGSFPSAREVDASVPRALDAVCRKALALNPTDRYASAQALAADVQRWLADEPVLADREPRRERMWRWLRRHRAASAGLAAALLVGLIGVTVGLVLVAGLNRRLDSANTNLADRNIALNDARQTAENQRDRAVAARQRTRATLDDMTSGVTGDVLNSQAALSPEQRAFLENVLTYYREFAAEPGEDREGLERLAKVHQRLGTIYLRLGRLPESVDILQRSVELFGQLITDNPTVPEYRDEQARSRMRLGMVLDTVGKRPEAEASLRAAVVELQRLVDESPNVGGFRVDLIGARSDLAAVLAYRHNQVEAEAEYRAALAAADGMPAQLRAYSEFGRVVALAHHQFGDLLAQMGKPIEAETEYRSAIATLNILVAALPKVPDYRSFLANTHKNLGILLRTRGRSTDAEAEYRAALSLNRKLTADQPGVPLYRRNLSTDHNSIGNLLVTTGNLAEAENEFRAAMAVQERLVEDYPSAPAYRTDLAATCSNLAMLLSRQGKKKDAVTLYRTAQAVLEKNVALEPNRAGAHAGVAIVQHSLAGVLNDLGQTAEAETAYRSALAIREKLVAEYPIVPEYRAELARTHNSLGMFFRSHGNAAAALAEYRLALALQEKLVAEVPRSADYAVYLGGTYCNIGNLLRNADDPAPALPYYDKSVALLSRVVAIEPRLVQPKRFLHNAHFGRAATLTKLRRFDEAEIDWRRAAELSEPTARASLDTDRANALALAGEFEKALSAANDLAAPPGVAADVVYNAACVAAVIAARADSRFADRAARRAVELLRQAIVAGFTDSSHIRADRDLVALRNRDDYAAVLWDLADQPLPPKPPAR